MENRQKEIERSIITTYRKKIWRPFTKAINEFNLIASGDKIAVCISGGKDSMLMAKLFQEIKRHGKVDFDLVFLAMNPGYNQANIALIKKNAEILGIDLTIFDSDIFAVTDEVTDNPCYLCARMRRGHLYSQAQKLGCNKIALGHHFDDVIETTLMSILYSGQVQTMLPKLHSTNFEGLELIRPMYQIKEKDIIAWRDYNQLQFLQCACRLTERSSVDENASMRKKVKQLIADLKKDNDFVDGNIYRSMYNINLNQVIGYKLNDEIHNYYDNYEEDE